MCLCSEIQHGFTQPSDNQELAGRLEVFLTQLYDFVSNNEHLMPHLPFTLQRKSAALPSTVPKRLEAESRIAKIYKYDPADYHVRTLLHRNFDIWDKQPESFFTCQQPQMTCDTVDPQSAIILSCLQLQQFDTHSRILRRFYCVALYRCRKIRQQSDDAKTIAHAIFPIYHSNRSLEEADDDMQSLITTIEILIQAGPRYENIAKKLGLGSLFLLGDTVSISVWERWLPKKGPLFEQAMSYLKDKGIIDLGEKYEEVANKILNHFEDILPKSARVWVSQEIAGQKSSKRKLNYQLNRNNKRNRNHNTRNSLDDSGDRTETEPAAPDHTAEFPDQFGVDDPATSNYNSISIDALLNTTEATTADGQSEIWNNRGESNGFASQTHDLHGKQRYVDLSFSQSKNGVTHGQGGAIGNSPLGDPDISAVPQTEGARQPIHAIEEHTIDGRIQTTNEQRKIEFVYSDPKEEKINSNLQEPFRSPVMARFQSGLGNHQQCIVVMFPRGWKQDVTFSITVDRGAGYEIIRMLDLQCLPQVQSPQGQVEQYSNMPKASLHLLGDLQQATIRTGSYKSAPGPRCACVSAFTSDGTNDDFTFSIMVDRDSGWELISVFGLKKIETGF